MKYVLFFVTLFLIGCGGSDTPTESVKPDPFEPDTSVPSGTLDNFTLDKQTLS